MGNEDQRTKLLMVNASRDVGGMEKLIFDLARLLHGDRFDVEVLFLGGSGRFVDSMRRAYGGRVHVFHVKWWDVRELWRVLRCLRAIDAEVIQCFGFRSDLICRLYRLTLARPCLVSGVSATSLPHVRIRRWLNRWTGRWVSAWWADCRARADFGVEQLGIPGDRIEVIHPAVDAPDDPELPMHARRVRERLAVAEDAQMVLTVGNLRHVKGHHLIVEAAPEILRKAPETVFVFVGEDLSAGAIPRLVEQSPCRSCFRLVGFEDEPLPYLAAADLVLQPSLAEGLPRVILEARSLGKPLLTTSVGGIPEIIEPADLIPAGDVEALTRATLVRLSDGPRSTAYREAGSVDAQAVARRFLELYASCHARASVRPPPRSEADSE